MVHDFRRGFKLIKTRREMHSLIMNHIQSQTHQMRNMVVHNRARNEKEHREMQMRKKKKFLVCGRVESGRVVWDIFELGGTSRPKFVAGGFNWQEEAISFARDRSLGRQSVSFKGVRCVLGSGRGKIMSPDKTLEMPGQKVVPIKSTKSGVVVG